MSKIDYSPKQLARTREGTVDELVNFAHFRAWVQHGNHAAPLRAGGLAASERDREEPHSAPLAARGDAQRLPFFKSFPVSLGV